MGGLYIERGGEGQGKKTRGFQLPKKICFSLPLLIYCEIMFNHPPSPPLHIPILYFSISHLEPQKPTQPAPRPHHPLFKHASPTSGVSPIRNTTSQHATITDPWGLIFSAEEDRGGVLGDLGMFRWPPVLVRPSSGRCGNSPFPYRGGDLTIKTPGSLHDIFSLQETVCFSSSSRHPHLESRWGKKKRALDLECIAVVNVTPRRQEEDYTRIRLV
jgi:hypothetical protein